VGDLRAILALPLALSLLALGPGSLEAKDHKFVGAKKCKTCHEKKDIGNQYDWWADSAHAKAFETLANDQAKKWAEERGLGDPQQVDDCVKCHVTAHGVPDTQVSRKFDRTAGVQCESCHGAGKDYRKKKVMIDRDLAVSKGLVLQSAEVCTTCHNDESPAWDPERYTSADGSKTGFDYDEALKKIGHPVPEGYDPLADEPD
jgi:hypothetical protein